MKIKNTKITKKMIEKENAKLSKKERKALNDANWVGKGTLGRPAVFETKKREKTRPNIDHMYRSGKLT